MFKSKGFTAAFIVLALMIVALLALFLYLVFGKGADQILTQGYMTGTVSEEETTTTAPASSEEETTTAETTTEETTTTESESETEAADDSIRALRADEEHQYPVIGEDIAASGVITIIKSGDNGEGIVFHALPQFDGSDAEGNVVHYDGSYDVTGKIYILNNGVPFVMYRVSDGHYCTSSPTYMSYAPGPSTIAADENKLGYFGLTDGNGVVCEVLSDDGNHVVFTLNKFNASDGSMNPVLQNVIAVYNSIGVASFEYHFSDGKVYGGTISFESVNDGKLVDLNFAAPIDFGLGELSEVVLHK